MQLEGYAHKASYTYEQDECHPFKTGKGNYYLILFSYFYRVLIFKSNLLVHCILFLDLEDKVDGHDIFLIDGFVILMLMLVLGVLGWILWRKWAKSRLDNQVSLRYPNLFAIFFRK